MVDRGSGRDGFFSRSELKLPSRGIHQLTTTLMPLPLLLSFCIHRLPWAIQAIIAMTPAPASTVQHIVLVPSPRC